ncbi:acetamidase/formamidase family protein [Ancylobacter mangrovi]|uniref:acetamidase/formamidase family protein n=1 Tax=Ancylobacter mangrovi TaxID=2972472 RepID=UPI002163C02D|nr:acetamidase/formamidase family protein [Ancylobacter mangrovi]MCS0504212.1 acetamidase/formamidase family protein [Ancylobacter mangrovi]
MAEHYLPARPGTVNWGQWDASLKPTLTIKSGDTVVMDTLSGEPEDMPDPALGFTPVPGQREVFENTFRGPGPHLLTGPVFVEGAEPGDVLEVRLKAISFRADWGWNIQMPFLGTLPEDFPTLRRIHFGVDGERGVATMPWGQELPLEPFFGNFGVAPAPEWGRLSSTEPRVFGGNMDNKELGVGSTIYFPVFAPGALFSAGDGHGRQGDGEVCLTAIETALTGTFEFHVRKDMTLTTPRAEKADTWITMAFDPDLDDAAKIALRDMIALIREMTDLSAQDAYTLCSLCADLRVTQTVDGNKGIHCVLPKRFLPVR